MLEEKLKEKEAAHALSVVDLQLAANASEERRLENIRLAEENKRLQEAEKQMKSEVETLRMNGEDLRLKLKESVDAHDETVQAAKARELEHERLVNSLVSDAERVNATILGKGVLTPPPLSCGSSGANLAGLACRLLSRGGRAGPASGGLCPYAS